MSLNDFVTLGRSGLRVSPLCLGTMTFGTEWGWGSEESAARSIFHHYLEAGGNFIDTANVYTNGKSETLLGGFFAEGGGALRDRVVLATKFTFNTTQGDPNAGGNGRKNIRQAIAASLRRLQTDYIDLYWLHVWDKVTPAEEVVATLSDLVREGKIRYYGFSDTPAWYTTRAQTLAQQTGKEGLIALQFEYSLVERDIEREHVPAAAELGFGICPWSPLAAGFLSGKYKRDGDTGAGDGRLEKTKGSANPTMSRFKDRNWRILEVLVEAAKQINRSPAQVALNWIATQPGVTSTIIGATKISQLADNLASIDFAIPAELRAKLDSVSAPELIYPYTFFDTVIQNAVKGGTSLRPWQPNATLTPAAPAPSAAKAAGSDK